MHRRRSAALLLCTVAGLVVFLARAGEGQAPFTSSALPAIDPGLVARTSRSPDSPEARIRASIRHLNGPAERIGAGGTPYLAGKLIVKFRDGTSSTIRVSTLATRGARAPARLAYADFDLVTIDDAADAEDAARAMTNRPEVEYAQPAYRVHAYLTPNDTFYAKQWNLPAIGMARAWDIQPSAGSRTARRSRSAYR